MSGSCAGGWQGRDDEVALSNAEHQRKHREKHRLLRKSVIDILLEIKDELALLRKDLTNSYVRVDGPTQTLPESSETQSKTPSPPTEDLPHGGDDLFSNGINGHAKPATRRTRLSPDWRPDEGNRQRAWEIGVNADEEFPEWQSFWIGDGSVKADWSRTFDNHCIKAAQRHRSASSSRPGAGRSGPPSFAAAMRAIRLPGEMD